MSVRVFSTNASTSQINDGPISKYLQRKLYTNSQQNNIIQEQEVETMIKSHLQQSFCKQNKKLKSKSLATLNTNIVSRNKSPQQLKQKRFIDKKQQISQKIIGLQKQCEKYGGADFMKAELIRNKITKQEQYEYYKQKIESIHGSLSLPRLQRVRGQSSIQSKTGVQNKNENSTIKKTNRINKYNKWYIQPDRRFCQDQHKKKVNNEKDVTKYVQKMLQNNNINVQVKYQYAPEIIREWTLKLGRDPLICSYAQIKRR